MFKQLKTPPGHVKERVYQKQVNQKGDVQRYGGLKAIKKDETIFAAYNKAEMRKPKIFRLRTHFQVSVLAGCYNVGSGRSGSNAIHVNGDRGTKTDRYEPNHN